MKNKLLDLVNVPDTDKSFDPYNYHKINHTKLNLYAVNFCLAICDLYSSDRDVREGALVYVFDDECTKDDPASFAWLCEILNLDHKLTVVLAGEGFNKDILRLARSSIKNHLKVDGCIKAVKKAIKLKKQS